MPAPIYGLVFFYAVVVVAILTHLVYHLYRLEKHVLKPVLETSTRGNPAALASQRTRTMLSRIRQMAIAVAAQFLLFLVGCAIIATRQSDLLVLLVYHALYWSSLFVSCLMLMIWPAPASREVPKGRSARVYAAESGPDATPSAQMANTWRKII